MKELLKQLIRTAPTDQNGELKAAQTLADYFAGHGISAEIDTWDDKRANLVATTGNTAPNAPTIVFGAHLDVVPANPQHWSSDPFEPVEKDGKVFGRGAVDMIGSYCAAAAAMVDLKNESLPCRVIFAGAAGEETDSCGVLRFVEQYRSKIQNPVGVVITEPTEMEIMRAHRGILWLNVQTLGKTAHGSMPHLGVNAVLKMNALLNRLGNWEIPHTPHPLLGGCSISPNRISGGSATNIVPDSCALEIDIRTLPGQDHQAIIDSLQTFCSDIQKDDPDFKTEISIIRAVGGMETPEDCAFVQAVCKATGIHKTVTAGFTTDGPHFEKLNAPVIIFGPGDGKLCHKPDEYIELEEMETGKQMYKNIITNIL